jgi:hypothetical protein
LLVEEQILLSNYFGFWANVAKWPQPHR